MPVVIEASAAMHNFHSRLEMDGNHPLIIAAVTSALCIHGGGVVVGATWSRHVESARPIDDVITKAALVPVHIRSVAKHMRRVLRKWTTAVVKPWATVRMQGGGVFLNRATQEVSI